MRSLSIKSQLMGLVMGLLVSLIGAGAAVQYAIGARLSDAMARIAQYERNINLATQWRGLTETNVQRVVAITDCP